MCYIVSREFVPGKLSRFLSEVEKQGIPVVVSVNYRQQGVTKQNHRFIDEFGLLTDLDGSLTFYTRTGSEADPVFTIDPKIQPGSEEADELIEAFSSIRGLGYNGYMFVINQTGSLIINSPTLADIWKEL